jgi:hypothetical protein
MEVNKFFTRDYDIDIMGSNMALSGGGRSSLEELHVLPFPSQNRISEYY